MTVNLFCAISLQSKSGGLGGMQSKPNIQFFLSRKDPNTSYSIEVTKKCFEVT